MGNISWFPKTSQNVDCFKTKLNRLKTLNLFKSELQFQFEALRVCGRDVNDSVT